MPKKNYFINYHPTFQKPLLILKVLILSNVEQTSQEISHVLQKNIWCWGVSWETRVSIISLYLQTELMVRNVWFPPTVAFLVCSFPLCTLTPLSSARENKNSGTLSFIQLLSSLCVLIYHIFYFKKVQFKRRCAFIWAVFLAADDASQEMRITTGRRRCCRHAAEPRTMQQVADLRAEARYWSAPSGWPSACCRQASSCLRPGGRGGGALWRRYRPRPSFLLPPLRLAPPPALFLVAGLPRGAQPEGKDDFY